MKSADKAYGDLINVMKDHLKPKLLIIAERFKFHHWNQWEEETEPSYAGSRNSATSESTSKKPWGWGLCVVCGAKLRWKRSMKFHMVWKTANCQAMKKTQLFQALQVFFPVIILEIKQLHMHNAGLLPAHGCGYKKLVTQLLLHKSPAILNSFLNHTV